MSCLLGDIVDFMHNWAPVGSAQSYDNVGLQIGRRSQEVSNALIALDLTPQIIQEAKGLGVELIVTHHPLFFKALSNLTDKTLESSMALEMAENGIALFSAHTNLDAARGGVSFELARTLGLTNIQFLSGLEESLLKLVVFVPLEFGDSVRTAAHDAGAGQIGAYSHCSFSVGGTGQFKPGSDTKPFIGSSDGQVERVHEVRIEMQVEKWNVPSVLAAIKNVHPYEEVVYDLLKLEQAHKNCGIGAIGDLSTAISLNEFLQLTAGRLGNKALRVAGHASKMIRRVAVCGGSGSDFIALAQAAGADVYVTGDVTYHRYFEVLDHLGQPTMALVDAGHYETEQMTEDLLVDKLSSNFPGVEWQKTRLRSSPVETWVLGSD